MSSFENSHVSSQSRELDVRALPSLRDMGLRGGRDNFREFCRTFFARDDHRFLRTDDDQLVVVHHRDLRAMAVLPAVANEPSGRLDARVRAGAAASGFDGYVGSDRAGEAMAHVFSNQFFFNNGLLHTLLRHMTLTQIGPKAIPDLESRAADTVRNILARFGDDDRVDLVRDIAERFTIEFWGDLIGLSEDEKSAIASLVRSMSPAFSLRRDPTRFRHMDDAFAAYGGIIERAVLRSLTHDDQPFVRAFATGLSKIEMKSDPLFLGIVPRNAGTMLAGILLDGFHTASVAAVNLVHLFARHRDIRKSCQRDASLLPAAISEGLRLEPPILMLGRYATSDVHFDGLVIAKDTGILMLWGAGNLDPKVFANPETFDVTRSQPAHTTFGGGAQICPGRHVAVMLVRALLQGLEAAHLEVEPEPEAGAWRDAYIMSQMQTYPIRLRRRVR